MTNTDWHPKGITPYYADDSVFIIHGDCMEVLPKLIASSVDLVVTDPPYSVGTTSAGIKGSWLDNNLIKPFFDIWIRQIKRILKTDGQFYINIDWRTYPFLYPIIIQKLRITNCIVWDYEWKKAGTHYRFSHEFIIYGQKIGGQKRTFGASERDVWRIAPMNFTRKEKLHQQEKPCGLISKMISNSSKPNHLILDPFLGSGTTLYCAKLLGRRAIGIEIGEDYAHIAAEKCSQAVFNLGIQGVNIDRIHQVENGQGHNNF